MDRRERRRRDRERKKVEEQFRKEGSPQKIQRKESPTHLRRGLQALQKTISGTRVLWSLVGVVLAVASGYALFHPHVSVEPELVLNPANPFSTEFKITNESGIFSVHDLASYCWTQSLSTSHNIGIWDPSRATANQPQHKISLLEPRRSSTIDCAPVMGGIGTYTGNVIHADIGISISYKQNWWPVVQTEYYPFSAMRDSQGVAHWMHVTSA